MKSSMEMKLSINGDWLSVFQLIYRPMAGLGEAVTGLIRRNRTLSRMIEPAIDSGTRATPKPQATKPIKVWICAASCATLG